MTALWLMIPLALLALAIAVLPVLVGSARHERSVKEGDPATTHLAAREANRWHRRLDRRTRRMPSDLEQGSNATVSADQRSGVDAPTR